MKTLITGGKSAQALKILKAFTTDQVLLGDYGEIPSFASDQYQFVSLGERNDDTIAHNLLNTCLDLEVDRLLPLYQFELEAVMRSSILFQEFNIHVLLPDLHHFPLYAPEEVVDKQNWAVFDRGELLYAAIPADNLSVLGKEKALNGVFYMYETVNKQKQSLFTIA
ncbi:hypothetical protein TH53_23410 [Pedobacter lusitanus]|uniref:Contig121, whole genome shotgun sequence n=1 Tax=Pedobacter lusitanus TaxID=1503925 RepID=A0A0D0F020_9SPHI|nr:hypothetical protein [Pedobacter lusitanus]KIO74963.1 hypothetical protein TH53_23410 [Pedobacter lusitanus]